MQTTIYKPTLMEEPMTLPTPDELNAQYEAGQIDLETAFRLSLHHIRLLYHLKEVDRLVINGLLQDVKVLAEELGVEQPSAEMRQQLLTWARQTEAALDVNTMPSSSPDMP
jgi:hypothetical protein